MVKKLVPVIVAILLMVAIIPAVPTFAAGSGDVNGTFTVGTPPIVTSVALGPTAMAPVTQYDVPVVVSAPDTFANVSTVVMKIWHNAGTTPTQSEFDGLTAGAADTCAIITWTRSTGFTTIAAGAGTTWALGTCDVPTVMTATSYTFHFVFTVGKIAMATTTDKWQVGVEATGSGTGFNYDPEGATMNFYGEITVPSTTVNWGTLTAGTTFTDGIARQPVTGSFVYIANGNYNKQVASSATWTATGHTATLDPNGNCTTGNQFSLKAATTLAGTQYLLNTTATAIDTTGARTLEAGNTITTMNLWIKLAGTFDAAAYNGTITYSIVNR